MQNEDIDLIESCIKRLRNADCSNVEEVGNVVDGVIDDLDCVISLIQTYNNEVKKVEVINL